MNKLSRYQWIWLMLILLLGGLLRVLYVAELRNDPAFEFPGVDAGYHDAWARAIVTGNWNEQYVHNVSGIPRAPYFRPPGYPFFLAGLYKLNSDYLTPRVAQSLLGIIGVFFVFGLARKWFGMATGLLSALFMSCYWAFIYFEGELVEPALLVILSLALVWSLSLMIEKATFLKGLGSGAVIGLFALVRPNILALIPLFAVWIWMVWRGKKCGKSVCLSLLGIIIGTSAVIAPVTIRNKRVSGEWVLISSNAGINLFIGNNEQADGLFSGQIDDLGLFRTSDEYDGIKSSLERKLGHKMTYSEVSRHFVRQAMEFWINSPVTALKLLGKKFLLFCGPLETGHNRSIYFDKHFSRILRFIPLTFSFALSSALLGIILLFRGGSGSANERVGTYKDCSNITLLMLIFIIGYSATFLIFFVSGQYRVPIVPFMLILGAYGFVCLWKRTEAGSSGNGLLWGAAWLVMYICASINWAGYNPNEAKWHTDQAVGWLRHGNFERAIYESRRAIESSPDRAEPYINMANALARIGRNDEAETALRTALEINPSADRAHVNLGNLLARQGKIEDAIGEYRTALFVNPDMTDARQNFGSILLACGKFEEASFHLRMVVEVAPGRARAHLLLAHALAALGDTVGAEKHYREACRLEPGLEAQLMRLNQSRQNAMPNVILIGLDTTRADHLSCCCESVACLTPNINRLASNGVCFARCFTVVPTTLASFTSVMSGLYPHTHGVARNGFHVPDKLEMLAERFKTVGYRTAGFVASYALSSVMNIDQGFDFYEETFDPEMTGGPVQRRADKVNEAVFPWLDQNHDSRFFLFIHYFDPHFPYDPPLPYGHDPDESGMPVWDHKNLEKLRVKISAGADVSVKTKHASAMYAAEIRFMDYHIGKLLDKLSELNLIEQTLIVMFADHGETLVEHDEELFDHGLMVYDTTIHVPLIISAPRVLPSGMKVSSLVQTIDITPTVCQLAGLPVPDSYEGQSLLPLLGIGIGDQKAWMPSMVFSEATKPWNEQFESDPIWRNQFKAKCVRTDSWKLVLNPLKEDKWCLFDLNTDPGELRNVYEETFARDSGVVSDLAERLKSWMNDLPETEKDTHIEPSPEVMRNLKSLGYTR